jgi:probable rRNA maturation factor
MNIHVTDNARRLSSTGLIAAVDAALREVCSGQEAAGRFEIDVILADDSYLADLNQRFRQRDGATDVISFSFAGGEGGAGPAAADVVAVAESGEPAALVTDAGPLGEVYISLQRAREQAVEYGASLAEEVARLVIHGALHLFGFDHIEAEDAARMKPLEEDYWRSWRAAASAALSATGAAGAAGSGAAGEPRPVPKQEQQS